MPTVTIPDDDLISRLRDSEVVVAMRERIPLPASVLRSLPALRLLVTTGMANASIDLDAAGAQNITVCAPAAPGTPCPNRPSA